ncbi:MAG: ABC transporter permease [Asgard group archaeon]|nr:ABC transporter permease [Asgard group archaeon]
MEEGTKKQRKQNPKALEIRMSFRRIGAYISAALRDFSRSPLTIFFTIAYPLILILLFGAIFGDEGVVGVSYNLYIQSGTDEGFQISPTEHLNFTDDFVNIIKEIKRNDSKLLFEVHNIPLVDENSDPINAGTYLEEVEGYLALVIPSNFTQELLFNPPINLTIIVDENSQSAGIAYEILSSVVYSFNLGIAGYNETKIGMETTDIYLEEQIEYFEFLIPGVIGIAIMNNGIIGTINRYSYFDRKGFFRKLSTSPMKKRDVVTGEASWIFIQGLISIIVILLVGWLAFKIGDRDFRWIIDILDWKILPISIAAVLNFTGLGMIGARLTKTAGAATAAGNFLSIPMMFLSGAFFEVAHIPVINVISKMLPLTYIIDALRASLITNNVNLAWINIGISFAFGVVIFIIGIFVTKLKE